ncbi:MAG: hypothetical protein H0X51_01530 [Parachlamydiaceae bacterium]|nr:hypothetical protein [Parachlamydiaceae bacterium]
MNSEINPVLALSQRLATFGPKDFLVKGKEGITVQQRPFPKTWGINCLCKLVRWLFCYKDPKVQTIFAEIIELFETHQKELSSSAALKNLECFRDRVKARRNICRNVQPEMTRLETLIRSLAPSGLGLSVEAQNRFFGFPDHPKIKQLAGSLVVQQGHKTEIPFCEPFERSYASTKKRIADLKEFYAKNISMCRFYTLHSTGMKQDSGDIVLASCEGEEFRLHSFLLKKNQEESKGDTKETTKSIACMEESRVVKKFCSVFYGHNKCNLHLFEFIGLWHLALQLNADWIATGCARLFKNSVVPRDGLIVSEAIFLTIAHYPKDVSKDFSFTNVTKEGQVIVKAMCTFLTDSQQKDFYEVSQIACAEQAYSGRESFLDSESVGDWAKRNPKSEQFFKFYGMFKAFAEYSKSIKRSVRGLE